MEELERTIADLIIYSVFYWYFIQLAALLYPVLFPLRLLCTCVHLEFIQLKHAYYVQVWVAY